MGKAVIGTRRILCWWQVPAGPFRGADDRPQPPVIRPPLIRLLDMKGPAGGLSVRFFQMSFEDLPRVFSPCSM
jgi:hypothetical protein